MTEEDYKQLKKAIKDSKPFVDLTRDLFERQKIQLYIDTYYDKLITELNLYILKK